MKQMKARETSPVRIRPTDKKYIGKLARQTRTTQTEILHRAVELLRREHQFQEMHDTYAGLSKAEFSEMQVESQMLDKAAGDGIE